MLAQLVQSAALTGRRSAVRARYVLLGKLSMNHTLKYALIFSFLGLYGCGSKLETASVSPVNIQNTTSSFSLIQDQILSPTCATVGCHSSISDPTYNQHRLLLSKGESYKNLIEMGCENAQGKIDNFKRVKPFNASESLLFRKLSWYHPDHTLKTYGKPMPLNGTSLYVGQIEFVRRWIEAGAPENSSVVDEKLLLDRTPGTNSY